MARRPEPAKGSDGPATPVPAAPLPVARLDAAEQLSCLRLIRSENVGAVTFRELINHFGGASRAIEALPELSRRGGRSRPIRPCSIDEAEAELERARRIGAEPVFTIEPGYPSALAMIDAPPPMIYIKGRTDLLERPAVAIVGSRQCSAAGSRLAALISAGLSAAGYVIVSGLARGIDRMAHEMALDGGTVAVLAGGVDHIYPPEHKELQNRIGEAGCLISERPPGFEVRGKDFPRRNRIISGMSLGVVIVEAAARSGTLTTARFAGEQGREVFAVPGHPLDPRAEGTNSLLKSGATLVTAAEDVIEALRPISGLPTTGLAERDAAPLLARTAATAPAATMQLDDGCRHDVVSVLGPAPVEIDAIVRATGLPIRAVHVALMELDLAGRLDRPGPGLVALRQE